MIAYLGIGSNLGDREENMARAIAALEITNEITVKKVSSLIETEPLGGPPQGKFLNGAIEIETTLSPRTLLEKLQELEKSLGKGRAGVKWGPRVIDLDILFYGDKIIAEDDLIVPHPLASERGFVLRPLAELNPKFVHPVLKKSIKELNEGH